MYDFAKYEGLGNDYIVIDPQVSDFAMTGDNIRLICDRHLGIGSDGILYGPILGDGRMGLRIFNPDGSESAKSGNGIRIFARYLHEAGYAKEKQFSLYTSAGEVVATIIDLAAGVIKVLMGSFTFRSESIPMAGSPREVIREPLEVNNERLWVTCVSVGNPHCVVPLEEISRARAFELGPLITDHAAFPNRTNVQLMKVLDRHNIQIEIWERGAGYTLASGSSSCASACAARALGLAESPITVHMPGGKIDIEFTPDEQIYMTGQARAVARGVFSPDLKARLGARPA
jgi:diaminopimelate epimerase